MTTFSWSEIIFGTNEEDELWGSNRKDIIFGFNGSDVLRGQGKNDILLGGAGDDRLYGDGGDDQLFGGIGADYLNGGQGQDRLKGGEGNDELWGESGQDLLFGGTGNDAIHGGAGNDQIIGGFGADQLNGDVGNDQFFMGPQSEGDRINGGDGFDTVDYSHVQGAIKISSNLAQIFNNVLPVTGAIGIADELQQIEKIIAPEHQPNSIDFSFGLLSRGPTAAPINVNLAKNSLTLTSTGETLKIQNFVNVVGSLGADQIIGNSENNVLEGTSGNDLIEGQGGDDTLIGAVASFRSGTSTLVGGAGIDQFGIPSPFRLGPAGLPIPRDAVVIQDFGRGGKERILVSASNFNLPVGLLSDSLWGVGSAAVTPEQRFIYDAAHGDLFYDSNGSLPPTQIGESPIKIASLVGAPTLMADQIVASSLL